MSMRERGREKVKLYLVMGCHAQIKVVCLLKYNRITFNKERLS